MRVDVIRFQRDEIVIAGQSLIRPLQRGKCDGESVASCGRLRVDRDGPPQEALRGLGIAALVLGHCEHMQRVEVAWALFQDLFVPGLGFGKIAEPVVRDRPGKQVCDLVNLPIGPASRGKYSAVGASVGRFPSRGVKQAALRHCSP